MKEWKWPIAIMVSIFVICLSFVWFENVRQPHTIGDAATACAKRALTTDYCMALARNLKTE